MTSIVKMTCMCVVLLLMCSVIVRARSAARVVPGSRDVAGNPKGIIKYLRTYGYLSESEINKSDGMSKALTRFQKFMGIIPSGRLTGVTKRIMKEPRCAQPDIISARPKNQQLTSLLDTVLKNKEVRYAIKSWSEEMPRSIQNQTITKMLRMWANDIDVACQWSDHNADIIIVFKTDTIKSASGEKPYQVSTSLERTRNEITIHFFGNAARSVKSLSRASAHSFGHVFGHGHSNLYSIMSPVFRTSLERMIGDDCRDTSIDAAFLHAHTGMTYFIKDNKVWCVQENYIVHGPLSKNATQIFKGLPTNLDDGFVWPGNWMTYVFQGSQYYRLEGMDGNIRVSPGYPQPISDYWSGIPNNIDAAFSERDRDGNFHTYFAKGNDIYKYDNDNASVYPGYPRPISDIFPGVPANIDTAMTYYADRTLYFFKGIRYWYWDPVMRLAHGPFQTKFDWENLCLKE